MTRPASLIINSPYERPGRHWGPQAADGSLALEAGRRPAGYEIHDPRANTRRVVELKRVNDIRKRVDAWREGDARASPAPCWTIGGTAGCGSTRSTSARSRCCRSATTWKSIGPTCCDWKPYCERA